jgi:hypothetical protein
MRSSCIIGGENRSLRDRVLDKTHGRRVDGLGLYQRVVFGSSSSVVDEELSLSSDVRLSDVEEDMLVV